jgi:hypothetical protein
MIGFFFNHTHAQFTRYIIKLKDKNGSPYSYFDPTAYLSQRAEIAEHDIALQLTVPDLPVNPLMLRK